MTAGNGQSTNWGTEWRKGFLKLDNESVAQFWGRTHSKYYDSWVMHSDYPAQVFAALRPHLRRDSSVIEVGAGTGGFTLLIARHVKSVTAVEPAREMADKLERRLAEAGITNVRVVREYLEKADVAPHDVVFGSHCFYDMDIDAVVPRLTALARERVVLATTLGDDHEAELELRQRRFRERAVCYVLLYNLIHDLGYTPSVQFADVNGTYQYADRREFHEHWQWRFHGGTEQMDEFPGKFLRDAGDHLELDFGYRTAIISYLPEVEKVNWFGTPGAPLP
ncbi:MAG TPA: class I SAM-dependent methyltransferase [Planctomycetota bacterium]|nr:class I SAM-dependent methyltransferase [Planctomycetota bacterium]